MKRNKLVTSIIKNQEFEYYERYWKGEDPHALFHDRPDWGSIDERSDRLNFFSEVTKGRILDLGCGSGAFTISCAKNPSVKEVYGIDISKTTIFNCNKKAKKENLQKKCKFMVGNVVGTPFRDSFFDSIFTLEVVEHILDVDKMFSECNRILKKGGYLGITTVDFNLLKMIVIALLYFEKYFDPLTPHIRFFTKNTLERLLKKNGFKVVKYKWDGSYLGIMPKGQLVIAQKYRNLSPHNVI